MKLHSCLLSALLVLFLFTDVSAQAPLMAKAPSFERDVLPILSTHCLKCHGDQSKRSGLDLRTPAAMLHGGTGGPVLVRGKADKSRLYELAADQSMPPGKAAKLTDAQLALLRAWIDAGAPAEKHEPTTVGLVQEKDRQFWAFQPPTRPAVPHVKHQDQVRTPIDAFILHKLEAKNLTLSHEADRLTLLRRLSFDLTGLPPTPEEIASYLADMRPDAYERLVERLLASPHYGERWGRHWLDAAGYSDSVGGDNDPGQLFIREGMWQYRDYVVGSLNADKPFDRFLLEQLAGDEMDDWRSASVWTPGIKEHLIATGLLRLSVDHTTESELNRPFERYQVLHDTIENLTSNLLGLTVACARCHDHKFDPIPQIDYYRLMAVLKPSMNPEAWVQPQFHHLADLPPKQREVIDRANADIDQQIGNLKKQSTELGAKAIEKEAAKPVLEAIKKRLTDLNNRKQSYGHIQAAWEMGTPPATYLLRRGNHLTPGQEVTPGYFAVLTDPHEPLEIESKTAKASSGRRTAWAHWLTRPDHPLTARVFVNRVWQRYFGEGIVATPDNLGHLGARPTHPELLDWLAVEFVESSWKMKRLHRLIVTSSVYRQASSVAGRPDAAKAEQTDPGNQLLWHMGLRRLESEAIRDAILCASGMLDRTLGGPPVSLHPQADGLVVLQLDGAPQAARRRSIYLFARRNYNLTLLSVFDQPVMATNCVRRVSSAVPLQSLTLLNDAMLMEQADRFADRVTALAGQSHERQVELTFLLAVARKPTAMEINGALEFLEKANGHYAGDPQSEHKALARLCHMLLCTNEFLYVG